MPMNPRLLRPSGPKTPTPPVAAESGERLLTEDGKTIITEQT